MGHERIGTLPKSKSWRAIVAQMAGAGRSNDFDPADLAVATLDQVRLKFRRIQQDGSTKAAFTFLVHVALAARPPETDAELRQLIGNPSHAVTPLKVARALRQEVTRSSTHPEYAVIAEAAAIDALAQWYDQKKPTQTSLFDSFDDPYSTWHKASTGAGFCELSRLFFANFLRRYLNYFLEREASSAIPSLIERDIFRDRMGAYVEDISEHAFETAKITQSYAAGWFNKYAAGGMPSEREVDGFLDYAFGKIRDELTRQPTEVRR